MAQGKIVKSNRAHISDNKNRWTKVSKNGQKINTSYEWTIPPFTWTYISDSLLLPNKSVKLLVRLNTQKIGNLNIFLLKNKLRFWIRPFAPPRTTAKKKKYQNLSECDCCHILDVRVHLLKSKSPQFKNFKNIVVPPKKYVIWHQHNFHYDPLKN